VPSTPLEAASIRPRKGGLWGRGSPFDFGVHHFKKTEPWRKINEWERKGGLYEKNPSKSGRGRRRGLAKKKHDVLVFATTFPVRTMTPPSGNRAQKTLATAWLEV